MRDKENKWQAVFNRNQVRAMAEAAVKKQLRVNIVKSAQEQGVAMSTVELDDLLDSEMRTEQTQLIIQDMMSKFVKAKLSSYTHTVPTSVDAKKTHNEPVKFSILRK